MVDINVSLYIQIVNFLVLIWALNLVLYKPIRNILIQRKERISGLENTISQSAEDAAQKDQSYKKGLKAAREKGLNEKDALENEARLEEKKLIEKINEKARADLVEIKEKVAQETQTAKSALQKEIDHFAGEISSKILGRAL